jgi:hypothetical protein
LIAGRTDEIIVGGTRRNHFALEVEDIEECEAFLKAKKIPMVGQNAPRWRATDFYPRS